MASIKIGKTSKRINSTSQTFSSSSTLTCTLKEPTSLHDPVFIVQGLSGGTIYNYAEYGSYYYWVTDVVSMTNNLSEVHCSLDVLATYKNAIKNTSSYVLYADSTNWNQYVDDVRFYPEVFNASSELAANIFPFNLSAEGCISLTFSQTSSVDWIDPSAHVVTSTGIHTALMSWNQFRACLGDLIHFGDTVPSSTAITSIGEACMEIIQAFARAMQSTGGASLLDNIIRCIWLPFDLTDLIAKTGAQARTGLMLGGVLASNTVWYETSNTAVFTQTGTLSPDIDTLTDNVKFLRNERFTSVQMVTPGGYSQVPADVFLYPSASNNDFHYKAAVCVADGSWAVKLSPNGNHRRCISAFNGNLGVNILGTVYAGPTMSSRVGDAISGVTALGLSMGIGNLTGGGTVSGINANITPNTKASYVSTGDFGGTACSLFLGGSSNTSPGMLYLCTINWAPKMIVDDPTSYASYCNQFGYPCNKYISLSNISGYVQCSGASVQSATGATDSDKSEINNFLNSGIYIE